MDWIQILIAILTILSSGVVAAIVTSRLNVQRQEQQFRRKKLEELYEAFMGFCTVLEVCWHRYMQVMAGQLAMNDALDQEIKAGVQENYLHKLEMLIGIYWFQFDNYLNALIRLRNTGANVMSNHRERYRQGMTEDPKSLKAITETAEELDALRAKFRNAVRSAGTKLR